MRESKIQSYLRLQVLKHGGILRRLRDVGATDRLVLWPGGNAVFVELKATSEKPRALQVREHKKLRSMGYPVEVLSSIRQVDKFIAEWLKFIWIAGCNPEFEVDQIDGPRGGEKRQAINAAARKPGAGKGWQAR